MDFDAQDPGFTVSFDDGEDGAAPGRHFGRRRRNRHGRGQRGPLMPASLPGSRTRAEQFEDLVVDSAARLSELWRPALDEVTFLVEEVPDRLEELIASGVQAPLGSYTPAAAAGPEARAATAGSEARAAVIVIYRHPVEALCDFPGQLRELVHEVLIDQVAGLLNIDPDSVDPLFGRFHPGH